MASSANKASWVVAASVGAVEALKDQAGLCRWNYVLRSLHQHAKTNNMAHNNTRMASAATANSIDKLRKERISSEEKARQSEESLRKVMYLSCWGPN